MRTEGRFWDYYPEGHYATSFYYCVEEHLSCLDENSLQQILELTPTVMASRSVLYGRRGVELAVSSASLLS